MENTSEILIAEQRKTNQLLEKILHEQNHKRRQESRRFFVSLIWQIIPLIIIGIILWGMYQYVHAQIELFQTKFTQIQRDVGSFNIGNQLKSFF